MSWDFDLTTVAQTDLVGIDPEVNDAVMDTIAGWSFLGPPRVGKRDVGGMTLYESTVAGRYLMAYVINDNRQHFAILWLREKPVGAP